MERIYHFFYRPLWSYLDFNEYICILFKVIGVQTLKYKSII